MGTSSYGLSKEKECQKAYLAGLSMSVKNITFRSKLWLSDEGKKKSPQNVTLNLLQDLSLPKMWKCILGSD